MGEFKYHIAYQLKGLLSLHDKASVIHFAFQSSTSDSVDTILESHNQEAKKKW